MLNLPSFNRLLLVTNTSPHLLKGLMASALLSLSFVSLSSHAATSNSVSPISRTEAANPANFYHLNMNGAAVTSASAPCSIKKGLIACGLEKLKIINSSINEVDADYDLAQAFYYPSKSQPKTAVVVITRSGLMDDSVSAERYRISFVLKGKPSDLNWQWVQYGVQYQCVRGNKAGKWSKNLCP
ncbi:hypothetical protein [Psychrobacter glacincola]|uniref:hypothetical protein n=1 Tax=Psychrobacter glacincola TaxID=56810 RepID=UPI0039AF0E4A